MLPGQASLFDLMPAPVTTPPAGKPPVPVAADAAPSAAMTEHCEIELVLHFDNAVRGELLVSRNGAESDAVWLRAAQVECTATGRRAPATTTHGKAIDGGLPLIAVNLPEPLAREKGLI